MYGTLFVHFFSVIAHYSHCHLSAFEYSSTVLALYKFIIIVKLNQKGNAIVGVMSMIIVSSTVIVGTLIS